ncbi:MAG: S41 family peptidase [Gammaproteobacteria bacterium]
MRKLLTGSWVCVLVLLVSGCGGGSGGVSQAQTTAGTCSITGQNQQILAIMQSWYYWNQYLPGNVDPASYSDTTSFLDALLYQPLDRFSYITTQASNQAFYGAGQYVGVGISEEIVNGNQLQLTDVYPDSPAASAGFVRGGYILSINGTPVVTLIANNQLGFAFGSEQLGATISLEYQAPGGATQNVTLTEAVITQPNVSLVQSFTAGGRQVGYFFFQNFITPSTDELQQAFAQFQSDGDNELIIDERYNGGGLLSVAQFLGSLVVGNGDANQTFATLNFNSLHTDQNQTLDFQTVTNGLNLNRVVIITTDATASASELLINALKPYIDVVTVGSTTFGKPVGENGFNFCSNVLYPMTFKMTNAAGFGDYFSGFAPTCPAVDDLSYPLGDSSEASLSTALYYIANGNCGPASAMAARALSRAEALRPALRKYGWQNLVNAY